jgi:hypothetical protein
MDEKISNAVGCLAGSLPDCVIRKNPGAMPELGDILRREIVARPLDELLTDAH